MTFDTVEAAEDAYYDALEAGDYAALIQVWADVEDIACALPMAPFVVGRTAVESTWRDVLSALGRIDLQTRHVCWIHAGDTALHVVEEIPAAAPGQQAPSPLYATNVYRRFGDGWRMVLHQNSPAPPPAGSTAGDQTPSL